MSGDPLTELFRCVSPSQEVLDWFFRQGVPPMALALPWAIAVDEVVFVGARFEFARHRPPDEAKRAIIIAAHDEFGDVEDLCAWRPRCGDLGSWLGRAATLGAENVDLPRMGDPLAVRSSPLEWLKARRTGVVIVDQARAGPMLRKAGTLAVENVAQGKRLKAAMTVRLPPVLVGMPGVA